VADVKISGIRWKEVIPSAGIHSQRQDQSLQRFFFRAAKAQSDGPIPYRQQRFQLQLQRVKIVGYGAKSDFGVYSVVTMNTVLTC
jgi:hypothetical protein